MKASPLSWSATLTGQAIRVPVDEPAPEPHSLHATQCSTSLCLRKTSGSGRNIASKESLSATKRRNVQCHVLAPGPPQATNTSGDEIVSSTLVEDASSHGSLIAACSPYVHTFELSSDDSARVDQLNQMQHINTFSNSPIEVKGVERLILDIAEGEAWGCVGRRLLASQPADPNTQAVEAEWPLQWVSVSPQLSIGSGFCRPSDVRVVAQATLATAIICLQARESLECLGANWQEMAHQAEHCGLAHFRMPSSEFDEQEQASVVVEAVRLLAGLLSAGHRVHVVCSTGCVCSPMVALVYESVVLGQPWSEAEARLKAVFPAARPMKGVWEQVKSLLVGDGVHRLTQLAEEQYERRISEGTPGSAADDWEAAQCMLMSETLEDMVARDVMISNSLAQAAVAQAQAVREGIRQEAEFASEREASLLASRIAQLERKHTAAMAAARSATEQMNYFARQTEELRQAEADARREEEVAQRRIADLERQLSAREDASEEAASLAGQLAEAEREVAAVRQREERLKAISEAAEERAQTARQVADDLAARLARMEEMEAAAKEAAAAAQERMSTLAEQVEEMRRKERMAEAVVGDMQLRTERAEASEASSREMVEEMRVRVEGAERETKKAREAVGAANERVTFFFRIMKGLRDRERAAHDAVAEANARLAAASMEAALSRKRDEVMREAWTLASERIELLSQQVAMIDGMRAEAREVAEAAAKEFLLSVEGAESTVAQREAEAARQREAELAGQVAELECQLAAMKDEARVREQQSVAAAQQTAEREERERRAREEAEAAGRRVSELESQLLAAEEREREAKEEVKALTERMKEGQGEKQSSSESPPSPSLSLKKELEVATASAAAARERSDFLMRQLAMLREKVQAEGGAREEGRRAEVSALRSEVRVVEGRERAAREQAAGAAVRVSELELQVEEARRREAVARSKWEAAQEKIGFFSRQGERVREREEKQRASIRAAKQEVASLSDKVEELKRGLAVAAGRRRESEEMVAGLGAATEEVKKRFTEASTAMHSVHPPTHPHSSPSSPPPPPPSASRSQLKGSHGSGSRQEGYCSDDDDDWSGGSGGCGGRGRRNAGAASTAVGNHLSRAQSLNGAAAAAVASSGAASLAVASQQSVPLHRIPPTATLYVPPSSFSSALPFAMQLLKNETRSLIASRQPVIDQIQSSHSNSPSSLPVPLPFTSLLPLLLTIPSISHAMFFHPLDAIHQPIMAAQAAVSDHLSSLLPSHLPSPSRLPSSIIATLTLALLPSLLHPSPPPDSWPLPSLLPLLASLPLTALPSAASLAPLPASVPLPLSPPSSSSSPASPSGSLA